MDVDIEQVFAALADPSRRQALQTLGGGQRPAGELARALGLSPAAMSRHLRVLLAAGLVQDERSPHDARLRVFTLRPDGLQSAARWLRDVEQEWHTQLAAYSRHVERRVRTRPRDVSGVTSETPEEGNP